MELFKYVLILLFLWAVCYIFIVYKKENKRYKPKEKNTPALFKGYCVYAIVNDYNNKIYVGMTGSFKRRKSQHFDPKYRKEHPYKLLYQAMSKDTKHDYNWRMIPIMLGLTEKEATYLEARLIKDWGCVDPFGYNVNPEQEGRDTGLDIYRENIMFYNEVKKLLDISNKRKISEKSWKPIRLMRQEV